MFFNNRLSEKGFGFIDVLAALFMVTIAIVGLFIGAVYARSQAIENYHYRSALLAATGKMELIKYYNMGSNQQVQILNIPGLLDDVVLDEINNIQIKARVLRPYPTCTTQSDIQVAPYVVYDKVTLRMTWDEPTNFFKPNTRKYITLREDYYRRVSQ